MIRKILIQCPIPAHHKQKQKKKQKSEKKKIKQNLRNLKTFTSNQTLSSIKATH